MLLRKQHAKYYLAISAALITFIVYLASIKNDFVNMDDADYIIKNPHIRVINFDFIRWAFFNFYASNWHPLTWISHALDYAIWGLNPYGHHITNNILHAVNTFLVVVLVAKLLDASRETASKDVSSSLLNERAILITSWVTGLLFGLHPLHVESAAWVAERKDLLCALFFILSILTYTNYNTTKLCQRIPSSRFFNKNYLLGLFFFIFALISKPMAVSLPVVLLILDWYPFKRIVSLKTLLMAFREKVPFIALSFISSIITLFAQKEAMQLMEVVPLAARCIVAAQAIIGYLVKMLLPINLLPMYPYPAPQEIFSPSMYISSVLIIVITAVLIRSRKKHSFWLAIWGFYLITLLPVLGIVQVGEQPMADRYTYLPSIGPFMIAGLCVTWSFQKVVAINKRVALFFLTSAVFLLIISMSYLTVRQIGNWRNSIILWDYVLEKEPVRIPRAYAIRAEAFMMMGQLDRAIGDYSKAISLNPDYYEAYINRGMVFDQKGLPENAIQDFDKAISLFPRFAQAYNNKGMIYGQMGSFENAIQQFNKAVALQPDYLCYFNRGLAYFRIGDHVRAIEDLNKAIGLRNDNPAAYGTRGDIYRASGQIELAVSDFRKACELGDDKACNLFKLYNR